MKTKSPKLQEFMLEVFKTSIYVNCGILTQDEASFYILLLTYSNK